MDGLSKHVSRRFWRVHGPERITWLVVCESFDSESQGKGEEGSGGGTNVRFPSPPTIVLTMTTLGFQGGEYRSASTSNSRVSFDSPPSSR